MSYDKLKIGLWAIVVVLIFGDSANAFNAFANKYRLDFAMVDDEQIFRNPNSGSPDSLFAFITTSEDYDFIKPRYTPIKNSEPQKDTIRRSSDRNIELLNTNGLIMLKSQGVNNFLTRNLFSLIVRNSQPLKGTMGVNSALYFDPFSGKKIDKIKILQLDVFGPSLQDTLRTPNSWIGKAGNSLHMKTTQEKLMGQLLFNTGEAVNPQLMAENEKFIRDLPYIQDVAITLSDSKETHGDVDVLVIIKERFEYGISGNVSSTATDWEFTNQNMFGLGHQFSALMNYNPTEITEWGGGFKYQISDLDRKFLRTGVGYTDDFRKRGWDTFIEKQFIASKEDWAGGVSLERVFSNRFLTPYAYTRLESPISYFNSDIWYGKRLQNNISYATTGNITLAGRFFHQNFFANTQSKNSLFRNHNFIMGAIGISKRNLFKNNQVYGYGITEDIPYGRYGEIASGLDFEFGKVRPYLHLNYSKATILNRGAYLKWQAGIGGYFSNSRVEQGALALRTTYFSNFVYLNRHPYRFFINMELLSGINRYPEEYLMINHKFGVRDYFSLNTIGTNRIKINIETVRFWAWERSGFRFAHYFFADAACLSNKPENILNDKFIGGIGVGIRVHNESLVFNVLEIRLSWIPIAPRNTTPAIFNIFGQPKARFDDFLGGKPQEITYQ